MSIRIHFDQIADLNPADPRVKRKRVIMPKPPEMSSVERSILESALRLYSELDQPWSPLIGDCLDFKDNSTRGIQTLGSPKHMSIRTPAGRKKGYTLAVGPSASAGAVVTLGVSAGVFFGTVNPYIGFYGSLDVGAITNVTASVVVQVMICWAPPKLVFNGPTVVLIGVNIGIPGTIATLGGFVMCFDDPPKPLEIFGLGYQGGVGKSVLPVDIFISKGYGVSTV